jgi:hypothetical protein
MWVEPDRALKCSEGPVVLAKPLQRQTQVVERVWVRQLSRRPVEQVCALRRVAALQFRCPKVEEYLRVVRMLACKGAEHWYRPADVARAVCVQRLLERRVCAVFCWGLVVMRHKRIKTVLMRPGELPRATAATLSGHARIVPVSPASVFKGLPLLPLDHQRAL